MKIMIIRTYRAHHDTLQLGRVPQICQVLQYKELYVTWALGASVSCCGFSSLICFSMYYVQHIFQVPGAFQVILTWNNWCSHI